MSCNTDRYATEYDPFKVSSINGDDQSEVHDNAVLRAASCCYKPPAKLGGCARKTLFVSRLSTKTTEETLTEIFSEYGKLVDLHIVRDLVTGISKKYAFVEYKRSEDARLAYRKVHEEVVDEHKVVVDWERCRRMKGWVPRRLGGGFGGKKESGQLRFGCRDKPYKRRETGDKYSTNLRNELK